MHGNFLQQSLLFLINISNNLHLLFTSEELLLTCDKGLQVDCDKTQLTEPQLSTVKRACIRSAVMQAAATWRTARFCARRLLSLTAR